LFNCVVGNSAYGCTLTNKERHLDVSFTRCSKSSRSVNSFINSKLFHSLDEVGDDQYEVIETETVKPNIKLNTPVTIGFFVLENAKLLLLQFYYDFLLKYVSFDDFCLIESDTDSLYLGLSQASLFMCIRQKMREEFTWEYGKWFAQEYCKDHQTEFFNKKFEGKPWEPKSCCKEVARFDNRTVGKLHVEWSGDGVIALCSKCYFCVDNSSKPKYSAKGVSKKHNNLTAKDYLEVLFTQKIKEGVNRGFRVKNNRLYTYLQQKKGLNYFYGKRKVCSDHITTYPTDL
jgi:hypothetical protein